MSKSIKDQVLSEFAIYEGSEAYEALPSLESVYQREFAKRRKIKECIKRSIDSRVPAAEILKDIKSAITSSFLKSMPSSSREYLKSISQVTSRESQQTYPHISMYSINTLQFRVVCLLYPQPLPLPLPLAN